MTNSKNENYSYNNYNFKNELNEIYYAEQSYQSPMVSYASLEKGQKVIVSFIIEL